MPGVSVSLAVAGGLPVPALWLPGVFASEDGTAAVSGLPASDLGDCGHNLSGHAHFSTIVVPGHVVGDDSEKWGQCSGATARSGFEAISNGLDVAA